MYASSAAAQPTPPGNPSAIVAAEGALAALAKAKGPGAALAANAAGEPAHAWLKTHDAAAYWAGHRLTTIWMACDGSAGVSAGTNAAGWFVTVWRRQKKGDYKWVMTETGPQADPAAPVDWVTGKLADCPPRRHRDDDEAPRDAKAPRPIPGTLPPADRASLEGRSDDGSLVWRSSTTGARDFRLWMWHDGAMEQVIAQGSAR